MTRPQTAILLAILAAAAALRLIGLDWGLRHPPHGDESAFVLNVHRMIAEGDLDHRYYEYPGLFFYVLYPFLRLVMGAEPPTAAAYLAARAVVAACGVAAVALQFAFARQLVAAGPALFSAALLAVSLVAVQTAHSVRPDIALSGLLPPRAHRHAAPGRASPRGPARGRRPRRRGRDQVLRRVPRPRAGRAPAARSRPPRRAASCSPGPPPPRSS